MKHKRSLRYSRVLLAGIISAGLVACSKKAASNAIETHKSGDLAITLLNDTGDLTRGQNNFIIEFKSAATGEPVDVGRVFISSTMSMPGMAPMSAGIELTPTGEAGKYRAKGDFAMSGAWRFSIQWEGPAGRGNTVFSQSVR